MTDEPAPILEDLQQEPVYPVRVPAVPVAVEGPVTVTELPARQGPIVVYTVGTFATQGFLQVLDANAPKRKSALIIADAAIFISRTGQNASTSQAGRWPANVPLPLGNSDALYACAQTGTANITVIEQVWSD